MDFLAFEFAVLYGVTRTMDFNPHTSTFIQINNQLNELVGREKEIADEVRWHLNLDVRALTEELRQNEANAAKLQMELAEIERGIALNNQQIAKTKSETRTLLIPTNWFSKGQVALRRGQRALLATSEQFLKSRQLKANDLANVNGRVAEIRSIVRRHSSVDANKLRVDLSEIGQYVGRKRKELDSVAEHKERVDKTLAPLIKELREFESRKNVAQSKLGRAQDLEQRLSSAANSYERAMIHEQCERDLGNGKPRSIIAEEQRKIRQIERDIEKTKLRAEETGRKAARIIEALVIDGNNLCYEGRKFIGLSAIEPLVPMLSREHSVVVVFDSAIRRMLQANDAQIQDRLGNYAKVHVVASRRLADETVLDLASANKFTYVISNDRFADFNEKSVVRDGRIIQHEIVNGHVFVPDLGLRATF